MPYIVSCLRLVFGEVKFQSVEISQELKVYVRHQTVINHRDSECGRLLVICMLEVFFLNSNLGVGGG